jgi:hypothetical protein
MMILALDDTERWHVVRAGTSVERRAGPLRPSDVQQWTDLFQLSLVRGSNRLEAIPD